MTDVDDGFWCPNPIDKIRTFLRRGIKDDDALAHHQAFVSHIAYNLQYLEFLNNLLTEKKRHITVLTQTMKTFVIIGMSVIEAVLWYVLRKNGMQKTDEREEFKKSSAPPFEDGESEFLVQTTIFKTRDQSIEVEMPLSSMIKKVESKKLLGVDHQVYQNLNYLRKLRNKVHLHAGQHDRDTDWYSFNMREVKLMKKVLLSVLASNLFKPETEHEQIIGYLNVEEPVDQLANEIP
ncbi:MAG: hypothetical protein ACREJN_01615 [Nitrospiraceae bacterium]